MHAEIANYDPTQHIQMKDNPTMDRYTHKKQLMKDSPLKRSKDDYDIQGILIKEGSKQKSQSRSNPLASL